MKLVEVLKEKGISKLKLAMMANIAPSDLYQCFNSKRSFFPAWRKRIANALQMTETELFPEYNSKEVLDIGTAKNVQN